MSTQTLEHPTTATTTETRTTWALDPNHTLIEFSAKHMMITTVKGSFGKAEGTIVLDESDLTRSQVDVTIDAASLETRIEQRDTHLRSADFLDVENHPTLEFHSTRIEATGENTFNVYGNLTIRGTTRPVTLKTELEGRGKTPWGAEVMGISAETRINRKDWGLNWNVALEAGGLLVGDEVKIAIHAELTQQS